MSRATRLARLERLAQADEQENAIYITGGLPDCGPLDNARASDGETWQRSEIESVVDFEIRVRREGAGKQVIWGGLPL